MKKILLYSAIAMVLGLLLTLAPLIVSTGIKAENQYAMLPEFMSPERQESLKEVYGLGVPKYSFTDLEVLAVSCVAALVAYALSKFRTPR